jgi:hypothetical protein
MHIGVTPVDRPNFLSAPVSGHRSATCDPVLPLMKDCHLTRTANVPSVGSGHFLEEIPCDEFTFVLNREAFPTSVVEVDALSRAVRGQHRVDASAKIFIISDREINSAYFRGLQDLHPGVKIMSHKSCRKSLFLFSWDFFNVDPEQVFFGRWGNSFGDIAIPLSTTFPRARPSLHNRFRISCCGLPTRLTVC